MASEDEDEEKEEEWEVIYSPGRLLPRRNSIEQHPVRSYQYSDLH